MTSSGTGRLNVQTGLASLTGHRARNEDYAAVCLEPGGRATGIIAALADGVGGQKGGREASELTVRSLIDAYQGSSESLSVRDTVGRGLEAINRWVHAQGRTDPNLHHMCTTLTSLVLRGRQLHVFHVGDSRAYRLRDGHLVQLTKDHVPDRGAVRNLLLRAVGAEDTIRIDYAQDNMEIRDRYLVCSDGLHGALREGPLRDLLAEGVSADETARRLTEAALSQGSQDNITAIVLDVLTLPTVSLGDLQSEVARLPIRPPPVQGTVLDGFELSQLISDGRYSRVFRAHQTAHERDVIIKFPKPDVLGAETGARHAFLRESWVASRVDSPFVGTSLDIPTHEMSCLYMVQPFYEGETLEARLLRRPAIALEEGLEIAVSAARGLAALHRAGVVHRDIKPENMILSSQRQSRDDRLKIIDLGIARLPNLDLPAAEIPGTPSYMAPELFEGAASDERSDVFALGVTLYRMFSGGRYPYGEIEPFSRPRFRAPASLLQWRPDLPDWLDILIGRTLTADPALRVQDAIELIFEIETNAPRGKIIDHRGQGLYARNPLLFWQITSLLLAGGLLASILTRPA